jgi:hypothetical protein
MKHGVAEDDRPGNYQITLQVNDIEVARFDFEVVEQESGKH